MATLKKSNKCNKCRQGYEEMKAYSLPVQPWVCMYVCTLYISIEAPMIKINIEVPQKDKN